jgi:hypothetical protein
MQAKARIAKRHSQIKTMLTTHTLSSEMVVLSTCSSAFYVLDEPPNADGCKVVRSFDSSMLFMLFSDCPRVKAAASSS